MIAWLTDTLLYTGVLIALVLLLRRPVTRHFGPQMSYALWALPLMRFVMPPVVLPASFAPHATAETTIATTTIVTDSAAVLPVGAFAAPAPLPVYEPTFWESWGGLVVDVALVAWMVGAAVFLAWRAWTYFRMREWLLDGARPVGEAGNVRLVETAAVTSPVAFGVSDKVVALPVDFMASKNRAARDLAIEHELAHHRGRDLLANMLAQPILALHWFNPLAWMGWRAMRRDQEAACDARVIAVRGPWERAAYGEVIASFAAGPRLALAAPMACPVLGEKSIIHRLRSLSMSDVSPRRRLLGRVLLAGAALALPLTASVSYAEASAAPRMPAPETPQAPGTITIVDAPEGAGPDAELHTRVIHKNGQTIILKTARPVTDEEAQASVERARASMARAQASAATATVAQREALAHMRQSMTAEEWAKQNEQAAKEGQARAMQGEQAARAGRAWAKQAATAGDAWAAWGEQYGKKWEDWGEKFGKNFAGGMPAEPAPPAAPVAPPAPAVHVAVNVPVPAYGCDRDGNLMTISTSHGATTAAGPLKWCPKVADANANARRALLQARARIQSDRQMDEGTRDQVLDSLDNEIDRLDEIVDAKS